MYGKFEGISHFFVHDLGLVIKMTPVRSGIPRNCLKSIDVGYWILVVSLLEDLYGVSKKWFFNVHLMCLNLM